MKKDIVVIVRYANGKIDTYSPFFTRLFEYKRWARGMMFYEEVKMVMVKVNGVPVFQLEK